MRRPTSQYAAVMIQFTDRTADFLAVSMTWEMSREWNRNGLPNCCRVF
jgi:hypothetical protein